MLIKYFFVIIFICSCHALGKTQNDCAFSNSNRVSHAPLTNSSGGLCYELILVLFCYYLRMSLVILFMYKDINRICDKFLRYIHKHSTPL